MEPSWVEAQRIDTLLAWIIDLVTEVLRLGTVDLVSQHRQFILVARIKELRRDGEELVVNDAIEGCENSHKKD